MMSDKKTKMFSKLLGKQDRIFNRLPVDKSCGQKVSSYLTEIYFRSKHLIRLTEKISETNLKFNEDDLDSLLGDLIDLRIEIYDEMVDWIKNLKKPLNVVIDKVGELGAKKYGWD